MFATTTPGVEPGPGSQDQALRAGEPHLVSYRDMGARDAWNAYSYFAAKAVDPAVELHGGCGPIATSVARNGYMALIGFSVRPGAWLLPSNPWGGGDVNLTTNWGLWWSNLSWTPPTLTDGRIVGGYVRLTANTPLGGPVRPGHAWAQNCSGIDVYDSSGMVALPFTPEMLST